MGTASTLSDAIKASSDAARLPDQSDYRSLGHKTVIRLAKQFDLLALDVEQTALANGVVPERYARNLKTYSLKEQNRLLSSTVTVVGLGGLGGAVVEILARTGIGCLKLIDEDTFQTHNLNRQLISNCNNLGTLKSQAATDRVLEINPSIQVHPHPQYLNSTNAHRLIDASDVVVDCLDDIQTRFILARAATAQGCPMVSAAVGGLCGHITTIYPGDTTLSMIYGQKGADSSKGAEASLGCLPQIVMMMAAIQCSEVCKLLLDRGENLRQYLLVVDLEDNTVEKIAIG